MDTEREVAGDGAQASSGAPEGGTVFGARVPRRRATRDGDVAT